MKTFYGDISVPEENCKGCKFLSDKNSETTFPYGTQGLKVEELPYFCTLFYQDLDGTNKCEVCKKSNSSYDIALNLKTYATESLKEMLPKLALAERAMKDFYDLMRWDEEAKMTEEQYESIFNLVRTAENHVFFDTMEDLLKFIEHSTK